MLAPHLSVEDDCLVKADLRDARQRERYDGELWIIHRHTE